MCQTTLARRAGEAFLDRADDPRRAVADHQQWIAQPSGAQILEERPHRLDVLLRSRHQPQKRFPSVLADPPGGQNRFSPLARPQPLGDAVDE